ncbi:hypothetical protein Vretifemale_7963, partial [Volvox reticuliferus]
QNLNLVQTVKINNESQFRNCMRRPVDIAKTGRPEMLEEDYNFTYSIGLKVSNVKAIAEAMIPHMEPEHQPLIEAIVAESAEAVRLCEVRRAAAEAGSKVAHHHLDVRNTYYNNRSSLALNPSPDVMNGTTRLYDVDQTVLKDVCKEVKVRKGINPMSEYAAQTTHGLDRGESDVSQPPCKRGGSRGGGHYQFQQQAPPRQMFMPPPPMYMPQQPMFPQGQGYFQPQARGYGHKSMRCNRQGGGH